MGFTVTKHVVGIQHAGAKVVAIDPGHATATMSMQGHHAAFVLKGPKALIATSSAIGIRHAMRGVGAVAVDNAPVTRNGQEQIVMSALKAGMETNARWNALLAANVRAMGFARSGGRVNANHTLQVMIAVGVTTFGSDPTATYSVIPLPAMAMVGAWKKGVASVLADQRVHIAMNVCLTTCSQWGGANLRVRRHV